MSCPTVLIHVPGHPLGEVLINEADFDPAKHTLAASPVGGDAQPIGGEAESGNAIEAGNAKPVESEPVPAKPVKKSVKAAKPAPV